jgi:penicillin-binding protein 1A
LLYLRKPSRIGRVMSPENAAAVTGLMVAAVSSGTGKAARLDDRSDAGKTGTTENFRDAWFVGFTADLVCGVWIGNDDNAPMRHATGGALPARIFRSFVEVEEQGTPARPLISLPATLAQTTVQAPATEEPDAFQRLLDRLFSGT